MNPPHQPGPASAGVHPVSFRRYEREDLKELASLAKDAWPARAAIGSRDLERWGMESYIEYSSRVSNWTDIACTEAGIVGFLFGRIDKYPLTAQPRKSALGELPAAVRSFLKRGSVTPWILMMIWGIVLTELKLALKMPRSDASIEMFIVDVEHRGKGIGRMMLDRFVNAARDAGSSLITVYTDDTMSNWTYYQRRGFTKIGTFHDNVTSHYSGLTAHGLIFVLDLTSDGKR